MDGTDDRTFEAWNAFVMESQYEAYPSGDEKRAAAIAKAYMNGANGGGINSFLTNSYELDAQEVLLALQEVGAMEAAHELAHILTQIGKPIRASSQEARWNLLTSAWSNELDEQDCLSFSADAELLKVLEAHVAKYQAFYCGLAC